MPKLDVKGALMDKIEDELSHRFNENLLDEKCNTSNQTKNDQAVIKQYNQKDHWQRHF